jgi:hypothetical protein
MTGQLSMFRGNPPLVSLAEKPPLGRGEQAFQRQIGFANS